MVLINCRECDKEIEVPNRRTKMCNDCKLELQRMRCRRYKANNREKISTYNKTYKSDKKEEISEYNRNYHQANRERIQYNHKIRLQERLKSDMNFIVLRTLRGRFKKWLDLQHIILGRSKTGEIREILGCDLQQFVEWIEFNFTSGMTWKNRGTFWHIDHVIPCCWFDFSSEEERKICFNWKNMRPLTAAENFSRSTMYPPLHDFFKHEVALDFFEKRHQEEYDHIDYNLGNLSTTLATRYLSALANHKRGKNGKYQGQSAAKPVE